MSSDRNPENFYENNIFNSIEIAELAEDVECTSANLISGIQGKFYINLLTPTQKTDKLKSRQVGTESTVTNYLMLNIHLIYYSIKNQLQIIFCIILLMNNITYILFCIINQKLDYSFTYYY